MVSPSYYLDPVNPRPDNPGGGWHNLNVTANSVRHWTVAMAVDEFFQNFFDEARRWVVNPHLVKALAPKDEITGNFLRYLALHEENRAQRHLGCVQAKNGELRLINYNTILPPAYLIYGVSDNEKKYSSGFNGKWGEGMTMALAFLCEKNMRPRIRTCGYEYTFFLKTAKLIVKGRTEDCRTLHFKMTKLNKTTDSSTRCSSDTDTEFILNLGDNSVDINRYAFLDPGYHKHVNDFLGFDLTPQELHDMPYHIFGRQTAFETKIYVKDMQVLQKPAYWGQYNIILGYNFRRYDVKYRDRAQMDDHDQRVGIVIAWANILELAKNQDASTGQNRFHKRLCDRLFDVLLAYPHSMESLSLQMWVRDGKLVTPGKGCGKGSESFGAGTKPACDHTDFKNDMISHFQKRWPNSVPYSQPIYKNQIINLGKKPVDVSQQLYEILRCPAFDLNNLAGQKKLGVRKTLAQSKDLSKTLKSAVLRSLPKILTECLSETIPKEFEGISEESFKVVNESQFREDDYVLTTHVKPRNKFKLSGFETVNYFGTVTGIVGARPQLNQLFTEITDDKKLTVLGNVEGVFESEDGNLMLYQANRKAYIIPSNRLYRKDFPVERVKDFVKGTEPYMKYIFAKMDLSGDEEWWNSGLKWREYIDKEEKIRTITVSHASKCTSPIGDKTSPTVINIASFRSGSARNGEQVRHVLFANKIRNALSKELKRLRVDVSPQQYSDFEERLIASVLSIAPQDTKIRPDLNQEQKWDRGELVEITGFPDVSDRSRGIVEAFNQQLSTYTVKLSNGDIYEIPDTCLNLVTKEHLKFEEEYRERQLMYQNLLKETPAQPATPNPQGPVTQNAQELPETGAEEALEEETNAGEEETNAGDDSESESQDCEDTPNPVVEQEKSKKSEQPTNPPAPPPKEAERSANPPAPSTQTRETTNQATTTKKNDPPLTVERKVGQESCKPPTIRPPPLPPVDQLPSTTGGSSSSCWPKPPMIQRQFPSSITATFPIPPTAQPPAIIRETTRNSKSGPTVAPVRPETSAPKATVRASHSAPYARPPIFEGAETLVKEQLGIWIQLENVRIEGAIKNAVTDADPLDPYLVQMRSGRQTTRVSPLGKYIQRLNQESQLLNNLLQSGDTSFFDDLSTEFVERIRRKIAVRLTLDEPTKVRAMLGDALLDFYNVLKLVVRTWPTEFLNTRVDSDGKILSGTGTVQPQGITASVLDNLRRTLFSCENLGNGDRETAELKEAEAGSLCLQKYAPLLYLIEGLLRDFQIPNPKDPERTPGPISIVIDDQLQVADGWETKGNRSRKGKGRDSTVINDQLELRKGKGKKGKGWSWS